MRKSHLKIILFVLIFSIMLGTTIWASLQQNLFTEFSWSNSPMWFKATIVDFYLNQFIIWLWVCYLEKKHLVKAFWFVAFFCTGSMGTAIYIIIRILRKKSLFSHREETHD